MPLAGGRPACLGDLGLWFKFSKMPRRGSSWVISGNQDEEETVLTGSCRGVWKMLLYQSDLIVSLRTSTWKWFRLGVLVKSRQSCLTLCDPWTAARQAPLSLGSFRQEDWSGLPCPPPGHLPDPGMEPRPLTSPALAGAFFTCSATSWRLLSHRARTPWVPASKMG